MLCRKIEKSSSLNAHFAILGGGLASEGTFYPSGERRDRALQHL